jgi:hypothetical protein
VLLRRSFAWSLVGLLVGPWMATARADPSPSEQYRFTWVRGERTEGCSSGAEIADSVTQRLGREVFSESARRSLEGVLTHEGDVWEVHLYVRDASGKLAGSRVLKTKGPTCEPIEAAATLAIALTIDIEGGPLSPATPSPPAPPSPPAAAPAEKPAASGVTAPASAPRPVERTPPSPAPSLSAVAALRAVVTPRGLLPAVAPGLSLAAEVPVHRVLRVASGVLYLPEQRTPDGAFAFGLTAAWLGFCFVPPDLHRVVSLSLCASAEVGTLHSVVLALEPLNPGDRAWVAFSVEGALRLRIAGPLEAEAGADVIAPLTRAKFAVLERPGVVFQQSLVDLVGFVGLGLSFP